MKKSIVVLGVGHSGTTIITKMIGRLGWNLNDADEEYAESRSVRNLNEFGCDHGVLLEDTAASIISRMQTPWVIKDPRFCETLHMWHAAFVPQSPTLVWITRSRAALEESYKRRGEGLKIRRMTREENLQNARNQFNRWPWAKFSISLEALSSAVALFDVGRVRK